MQDGYAGDIGDYVKFALLRHITPGRKLGVAWYLYGDKSVTGDGKHTDYLDLPERWRQLDGNLFDALHDMVKIRNERSVAAIQRAGVLDATFFDARVDDDCGTRKGWDNRRRDWSDSQLQALSGCDIVFADPDNGLVDDKHERRRERKYGKRIPLGEVQMLSEGRTAIIYHHNTRRKGGHDREVDFWLGYLPNGTMAVRSKSRSARTFFVINADEAVVRRVRSFCDKWKEHGVCLHNARAHDSQG
jgi:hypothetical protein